MNKNDALCADYKFDRKNTCLDCSIANASTGNCVNAGEDGCSEYKYDTTDKKCYDCSLPDTFKCKYATKSGCADYGYGGTGKCYDCSIATSDKICLNQSIAGCVNYRYNDVTNAPLGCVDCSLVDSTSCL